MKVEKANRRKLLLKLCSGLATLGVMLSGLAWAGANNTAVTKKDLAISLTARKVITHDNGQEQLLPAERAFPGEVIQYDALYVNQSLSSLRNVSPTLPIPNGMVFVPGSASPRPAEASLDGQNFAPIPIKRKVVTPTGEEREEEVSPTQYRALRWHLGAMASGTRATVSARTKLVPTER